MHVAKLRVQDEMGLVPAGRYFEKLAKNLRTANVREQTRSAMLDADDRDLEASYRRASAARLARSTCTPKDQGACARDLQGLPSRAPGM